MKGGLVAVALNYRILNYFLNKYCPYMLILFLLFFNSGLDFWRGAAVFIACIFMDKFSFSAGYSVAYCESRGIDLNKDAE